MPPDRNERWLLWDVENCAALPGQERAMLAAMIRLTSPVDRILLAGGATTFYRYRRQLRGLGVECFRARSGRDRADKLLIGLVSRRPQRTVLVASDDGRFNCLARSHQLMVITRRPELVSKKLARVASATFVIDRNELDADDGEAWPSCDTELLARMLRALVLARSTTAADNRRFGRTDRRSAEADTTGA